MKNYTKYYTRKEFEEACGGIQRSTLRYYERAGILKPARIDKNGYKYYSQGQMYTYFHISMLRSINCSVAEIGEIFSTPNAQYKDIFASKKVNLDEMINSLTQMSKTLEMINYLVEHFPIDDMCIPRVRIGTKPFYYRLRPSDGDGEHGARHFIDRRKIDRDMVQNDYRYLYYPMGVMISRDSFLKGNDSFSDYILMVADKDDFDDCMSTGVGPTVTYSYTSGTPLTQVMHLDVLRRYILDKGLTLTSDIHEAIVPMRVNSDTEAEYLNIFSADVKNDDVFRREMSYYV